MSKETLEKSKSSRDERSTGARNDKALEKPNITFIQDRKKKVGPKRYKKTNKNMESKGNRSKKKLKNRNSDTKNMDPGKPKKIKLFNNVIRNSLGHMKFIPLISVSNRVLKRRAIASTRRNELVESKA